MELSKTRKRLILGVSCVEAFMATLDGSIVNIALPDISAQMHVSISAVQWVSTAYLLAIVLLLLLWGKLADLRGKKGVIIAGFLFFAAGSALCSLSRSLDFLIFARIIQAVGAGAMMSLSQGIVTSTFGPGERGAALGQVGMMVALGSLTGPFLGGILVSAFRWPSIFVINVPIAVGAAILSFYVLPAQEEKPEKTSFDWKGTALFSIGMLVLFLTLLLAQQGSIQPIWLLPAVLISAGAFFGFVQVERHSPYPLVHMGLFRKGSFTLGLLQGFLIFIALSATLLFIPFYLQDLLRYDAFHAGLIVAIYPITMAVVSPLSGRLADRMSTKPLTAMGTGLSMVALFLLAFIRQGTPLWIVILALAVLGVGNGLFQSPNNSDVFNAVPPAQLGIAGGINALFRNVGFVSGTAFSVLIFSFTAGLNVNSISGGMNAHAFLHGFSLVFVFCGICAIAALALCFVRIAKNAARS
ncbi:MFS transporter [Ethanoligenens sp.]|uniref:MFS transporter n=1 Tax=Ethanoligenens sp. TaxID=2099655 RepID=UPI0039ECFB8D